MAACYQVKVIGGEAPLPVGSLRAAGRLAVPLARSGRGVLVEERGEGGAWTPARLYTPRSVQGRNPYRVPCACGRWRYPTRGVCLSCHRERGGTPGAPAGFREGEENIHGGTVADG